MLKFIRHRIGIVRIFSVSRGQFSSNIEFYVYIDVGVIIGRDQKFYIALFHRRYGRLGHLGRIDDRCLYAPRGKNIV